MKKKAYFRFYEELNDFLPAKKRKQTFEYYFWGNPSVKDAIQAQGIPKTEVDLVLVNNTPVDFNHCIDNGDRIAVYPVFESFDISQINPLEHISLRDPKFILDTHLGKLARYMRMCGFDSLYENNFTDKEIIQIGRNEKRAILTRDKGILKNNAVTHGYYLKSQDPKCQLQEVVKRFDLKSGIKSFSRCMECNELLVPVNKNDIAGELDEKSKYDFDEFFKCKGCRKIYWKGSHYANMKRMINELLTD